MNAYHQKLINVWIYWLLNIITEIKIRVNLTVLYKFVCQRAFHDAENVYNFVVGSFVKRSAELLSFIQTSSKFKVYIFAKNLHHFYSFGHRMLVSSTVQSKPGVKHVKQIKILLQKQTGYTLADAYPEILETAVLVLRHMDNIT